MDAQGVESAGKLAQSVEEFLAQNPLPLCLKTGA
jgi:hypothetical protein